MIANRSFLRTGVLSCCILFLSSNFVAAKVVLPAFFSDGMVLQQQTDAALWGWAKPAATVKINTSWNKKNYTVTAEGNGKWSIKIATPVAGGPYSITISDGEALTIKNILIGEVWLCSGQSNMEMPMKGFKDQPIIGSNDAIFNSTNDPVGNMPRACTNCSTSSRWKVVPARPFSSRMAS